MFAWLPAALLGMAAWCAEEVHTVPYVPSAASEGHAGVVRIESRSGVSGQVRVVAVDDAGQRMEAGRLTLDAGAAIEFETGAMESGDASTGLTGTGPGQGDWRLELSTDLDIEARAYARSEGFATALHDAALVTGEVELPLFNPGGEARPRSVLRLANARGEPAAVSVRGVDDAGRAGGPVTAELGPWEARGYAASELESGSAAGLTGSLGDGDGKWRLTLSADRGSAYATNLLLDGSVLSSVPGSMSRGSGGLHRVPLFPPASDGAGRRGVVRVVNRSAASAEVSIEAFDATDRAYEELRLALKAESSAEFDATDLEQGNAEKGLTGSTGPGEGDWWLELTSESDIEVLSYVDTASGPLSALRGTSGVETDTGMRYEALLWGESGEVRLLNAGGAPAEVRLSGVDDAGSSGGAVELTLAPWSARTLTATALAEGEAGMLGALGAGSGSWRLRLEADREIDVLSLVRGSGGMLSDVSRRGRPAGAPPRTEVIDATARGRPDLWVAASASEAELSPGEAFELTATVGNRGGSGAPPTTLRYYRSADATITAGDAEAGADAVAELGAGATSAGSLTLNAPSSAGAYYYGACADAVPEETKTSNNCSAAVAVKVTEPPRRPDLAVAATPSDAELEPGESFALSATVRNRGGAQAQATTLRYYRSADASITAADAEVGTDAVDALSASGTSAESITLTAPSTAGIYYYGACVEPVDGESDTTNNCSPSIRVDVVDPGVPDLEVGMPLVDDASPEAGGLFTLSATVTNAGDGVARSTTLRYYRSADATIARSDTEVGTDAVNALAASGTSAESIRLTAPSTAGIYYYGACVEPVDGESDTTNNCSPSIRVDVVDPGVPDLEVGMPLVDDASPEAGGLFTLSATVTNAGDGVARSTTLRYYRSADATIARSDTEVGTDAVNALAASGTSAESIRLTAPSTAGIYYYGACVEPVDGESDTTNNCSPSIRVDVVEPGVPDLEVGMPLVDDASPEAGGLFTLSATVTNAGDGVARSTTLRYYRSADATIATSDTEVGTDAVNALAASGTSAESIRLTAPSTAGIYYYGACVEPVDGESDTTNNCSPSIRVDVVEPGVPDLEVGMPLVDDASPEAGGLFTLSATVTNAGDGVARSTTLRYYRSADATIATSDTEVGTDAVNALAASGTSAESIRLTAPSTAGIYYYGACVEPVDGESDTTNNCSPSIRVDVVEPGVPDLEVGMPLVDDASPEAGGLFTLSATVTNAGDGVARSTTLRYYRSADATIATSDTEVGTDAVNALAASGTSAESIRLTAPSTAGIYYYGACVEPVDGESDTTNNCSPSIRVDVVEPGVPDLEVGMPLVDDASPEAGGLFTLSATVTNAGDGVARSTTLRYYRSADATIATSDTEVGTDAVNALAASGRSAESIGLTAPSTAGAYYYGMCVDAVPDESDTTNNCSVAVAVTVRERPPDLTVTTTLSESGLPPGDPFTLMAEVRNVGGADAAATTVRYYRSTDGMIGPSDTELGAAGVPALAAGNAEAGSLELTAPASNGTYHYGACVDAVPEETNTANNCSAVSLTVGRPDLAATISGIGIRPDGGMAVFVTVSNVGTAPAGQTQLRLYGSADATRSQGDFQAPRQPVVAPLEPGAERCYWWGSFLPPNRRDHWYADVGVVRHETSTDNNESAVVEAPHECPTCRHRRCIDF